jgi:putative ABC transport system substrate-binding protein
MVAFLDELRLHGFVEGRNLTILPGGLQFRNEQINELVSTMVKAAPDAIVGAGDVGGRALQKATRTIPLIIMTEDMVAAGLAASLARPGGTSPRGIRCPRSDGRAEHLDEGTSMCFAWRVC